MLPIDFTGGSEELLLILISVDRDRLEIDPRSEIRLIDPRSMAKFGRTSPKVTGRPMELLRPSDWNSYM